MKCSAAWFAAASYLLVTSCHRPYPLYQKMPVETFRSPAVTQHQPAQAPAEPTAGDSLETPPWTVSQPNRPAVPESESNAYASSRTTLPLESQRRLSERVRHSTSGLPSVRAESNSPLATQQPRPRPKPNQKKTLREMLGLKPRKKLNWWQRIPWQLKASIPIILVAVVFAIFKVTILAIIFGLLGAFLLIRGMKRAFRVRRPWF